MIKLITIFLEVTLLYTKRRDLIRFNILFSWVKFNRETKLLNTIMLLLMSEMTHPIRVWILQRSVNKLHQSKCFKLFEWATLDKIYSHCNNFNAKLIQFCVTWRDNLIGVVACRVIYLVLLCFHIKEWKHSWSLATSLWWCPSSSLTKWGWELSILSSTPKQFIWFIACQNYAFLWTWSKYSVTIRCCC